MNVLLILLLVFLPVLTLAISLWGSFLSPLLGRPLRERLTVRWPVVAGTIEAFDSQPRGRHHQTLFLFYSYKVNERFYSGQFSRVYDSYDSAYFAWRRWKGLRIPIRYKPTAPAISFFPERTWRREQPAGFDRPRTG